MKYLIAAILYCSSVYGQKTSIIIDDRGLFVNSEKISQPVAKQTLLQVLGKPERKSAKANIVLTCDSKGIRLYLSRPQKTFSTLSLDIKKENYSFSPVNTFDGTFSIYGVAVERKITPADLLKVKSLHLYHSYLTTFIGYTDSLILSFDFSNNKRELKTFSVWFRNEDDSIFVKAKPVEDTSVYLPLPVRQKIINYDTATTHYANGKWGEPGYKTWDSVKVRADIILEGYADDISCEELTPVVMEIMNEKGIDVAYVFRSEVASMFFRMSSPEAARVLKTSGGYLGEFKRQ